MYLKLFFVLKHASLQVKIVFHSGEQLAIKDGVKLPTQGLCSNCGYVSSNVICKACVLLEGLNRGRPKLAIGKSNKALVRKTKLYFWF